ncbi:MAG: hypothetical protein RI530_03155 [Microbacteriaceae bacterium]|nr:hypothetical protein [Microbacteriaceae bacterium]
MRNKAVVVVALIGVLATSVAFILGIITGANNAGGALIQDQPNENCFIDPNPEDQTHAETKLVACEITGMTEGAGIDYAESKDIKVRIAARDGEGFALTEDYRFDRINIELQLGVIVVADAW